ncbi:MAG: isoleucine--tRNA ligase [Chloroflexota bacterium]
MAEDHKTAAKAEAFQPVTTPTSFPKLEEQVLQFWRDKDVFRRSLKLREGAPEFVFYEGPPTANGRPHAGHVLPRAMKDLIPRYKSMTGYHVSRKAGWDTHGLPVELEIEKKLGISGKPEIEKYGIEKFIDACKDSVLQYTREWEQMTERIGYWLDLSDPYITYDPDYVESVWWALKQIWDKGLLYKGHRVVPYCPRCGTPLSSHEVAQGYEEVEDPSIFVRMPVDFGRMGDDVKERAMKLGLQGAAFLVWTTTPWTLPSNTAIAVKSGEDYVLAEVSRPNRADEQPERLILAKALLEAVFKPAGRDCKIVAEFKADELLGMAYEPPFPYLRRAIPDAPAATHTVIAADFVTLEDGTGIVHMAPAFGEDDARAAREHGLPHFQPVDAQGRFSEAVPEWQGQFVKDADQSIIENLRERGRMFRATKATHTYPFCWRCDSPLLYYSRDAWYIRTTAIKEELLANNETINWYPDHLKHGRFGNWLDNVVDWCISRARYWGTPLPIWACDCGHHECIGSFAELREKAANKVPDVFDPHKPGVDEIVLNCPHCGGVMHRVFDVIDCWFDSGSMPFAQYHYPFATDLAGRFPADFICEAIDQTRGWFYTLLVISTLLKGQAPYKNVLVTEFGVDAEGQKMSKHKGNVLHPQEVLDKLGADALRWFLYVVSPPWLPKRFSMKTMAETQGALLGTLWNVYAFFVLYANVDGWSPADYRGGANTGKALVDLLPPPEARTEMDRWILSRLNSVTKQVRDCLEAYDITPAARAVQTFVDDLSKWYLRRNRRRYWTDTMDADKQAAYLTLYHCLTQLSLLLAPFTPFAAEALYQNLVAGVDGSAPLSVHLCDYPQVDATLVDAALERRMETLREFVALGRAARDKARIGVRMPLPLAVLNGKNSELMDDDLRAILAEELNVREVRVADLDDYLTFRIKLRFDKLGPRVGKGVQDVARALGALPPSQVARATAAGETITVGEGAAFAAGHGPVELTADEIEVKAEPNAGFAVEADHGRTIVLDLTQSRDLLLDGLAREIVSRIQRQRKEAGLNVEDRIITYYRASGDLAEAVASRSEYIASETLTRDFVALAAGEEAPAGASGQEWDVLDEPLYVAVKKA